MIQAITCASVPTSGAGMSLSGPMKSWICWTNLRVSRSSSPRDSLLGSQFIPPLPPPKGRSTTAVFQVIRLASDAGLVLVDVRVVAQAPLERPPGVVVLDAVADEVADLARVHLDGHLDPQLAVGGDHQGPHVVGQVEQLGGLVEIVVRGLEGLHRTADPRLMGAVRPPRAAARPDRTGPPAPPAMRGRPAGPPRPTSRTPTDAPLAPRRDELRTRQGAPPRRGGRPAARGDRAAQPPPALRHRHAPGRGRRRARLRPGARGRGRASCSCRPCPTAPRPTRCGSRWP